MIAVPDIRPHAPEALKQLLLSVHELIATNDGEVVQLQEHVALLRDRLFGRKSEQTSDPESPQLPLVNEADALPDSYDNALAGTINGMHKAKLIYR